jgi:hypothetical protein
MKEVQIKREGESEEERGSERGGEFKRRMQIERGRYRNKERERKKGMPTMYVNEGGS